MENASKALIIAGAILLSILIITLGLTVYNQAKNSMGSSNLDAQEIRAHNSQFLSYEGKQKGTQVKSLITAIRQNNRDYTDRMIQITNNMNTQTETDVVIVGNDVDEDPNGDEDAYRELLSNVKNNTTYFVTFGEASNGCIGGVEIHIWSQTD